jgi:exodeoxyribonuclease VII large subunit
MNANAPQDTAGRKVYGISELTRLIKSTLETAVGDVWVEGEISNLRRPASGHLYFTIKDANAQLGAVLFRGSQRGLSFEPADGLQVRAYGEITVYERGGNYQIIVRRLEEAGRGALQQQFEQLKQKLRREGLFDEARKRPIPVLPRHVGVVTSPTGAAIRDILQVIMRRFPNLHVVVAPARVQGEGAAAEIAAAIDLLNARGGLDVMIVGRGGGSLEDLWCFNEETVARAIARSAVPVISAVGHEIDFTISDFAADLRAPTPSAAAELVVDRKDAFEERLGVIREGLFRLLKAALGEARQRLRVAAASYVFREPGNLARRHTQRLETIDQRLRHVLIGRARDAHQRVDSGRMRLERATRGAVAGGGRRLREIAGELRHAVAMAASGAAHELGRKEAQLKALSPLAVLARGYSVTLDSRGRAIKNAGEVGVGDTVRTRLHRGAIESGVLKTEDGA